MSDPSRPSTAQTINALFAKLSTLPSTSPEIDAAAFKSLCEHHQTRAVDFHAWQTLVRETAIEFLPEDPHLSYAEIYTHAFQHLLDQSAAVPLRGTNTPSPLGKYTIYVPNDDGLNDDIHALIDGFLEPISPAILAYIKPIDPFILEVNDDPAAVLVLAEGQRGPIKEIPTTTPFTQFLNGRLFVHTGVNNLLVPKINISGFTSKRGTLWLDGMGYPHRADIHLRNGEIIPSTETVPDLVAALNRRPRLAPPPPEPPSR